MSFASEFADFVKCDEPLAPYTQLRLGGPAQYLARPRSRDELAALLRRCGEQHVAWRVLGAGSNVLIRDEGVRGLVLRLSEPAFTHVEVKERRIHAAAGAPLSGLVSQAARHALAGLEALVGIPGTIGGALHENLRSRAGDLGQLVRRVELMDPAGQVHARERDELRLGGQAGGWDEGVILATELELEADDTASLLKRMRKFWIHQKAHQPLSFEHAARLFKDPRALTAEQLIDQAGLKGTRVGAAEISDRHSNYLVAHAGATARDVLRLIDLVRSQVAERFGQTLQLSLVIW